MTIYTDAQQDAAALAKLVNEDTDVTTRYGVNPKKSGPKAIREFEDSGETAIDIFNANGDTVIDELKKSRGYRVVGTFAAGFTYELPNDVGIDSIGNSWVYAGTDELPFTVPAGTNPSSPTYTQVTFNDLQNITNRTATLIELEQSGNVQNAVNYITPEMFGAVGNANYLNPADREWYQDESFTTPAADDFLALQNAFDSLESTGGTIILSRRYRTTGRVFFSAPATKVDHFKITGVGNAAVCCDRTLSADDVILVRNAVKATCEHVSFFGTANVNEGPNNYVLHFDETIEVGVMNYNIVRNFHRSFPLDYSGNGKGYINFNEISNCVNGIVQSNSQNDSFMECIGNVIHSMHNVGSNGYIQYFGAAPSRIIGNFIECPLNGAVQYGIVGRTAHKGSIITGNTILATRKDTFLGAGIWLWNGVDDACVQGNYINGFGKCVISTQRGGTIGPNTIVGSTFNNSAGYHLEDGGNTATAITILPSSFENTARAITTNGISSNGIVVCPGQSFGSGVASSISVIGLPATTMPSSTDIPTRCTVNATSTPFFALSEANVEKWRIRHLSSNDTFQVINAATGTALLFGSEDANELGVGSLTLDDRNYTPGATANQAKIFYDGTDLKVRLPNGTISTIQLV